MVAAELAEDGEEANVRRQLSTVLVVSIVVSLLADIDALLVWVIVSIFAVRGSCLALLRLQNDLPLQLVVDFIGFHTHVSLVVVHLVKAESFINVLTDEGCALLFMNIAFDHVFVFVWDRDLTWLLKVDTSDAGHPGLRLLLLLFFTIVGMLTDVDYLVGAKLHFVPALPRLDPVFSYGGWCTRTICNIAGP